MANDDENLPASEGPQQPRRRRGLIIATGAAALAVAGLVALQLAPDRQSDLAEPQTLNGLLPDQSSSAPISVAPSTATTDDKRGGAQGVETGTPTPKPSKSMSVKEEIKEAREAAAKAGYPLRRPLVSRPKAQANGPVEVTNKGSLKDDGATLRTVSAEYDLTGQRELLWAAGEPKKVGPAECTQKFRFDNDSKPKERPTMLLCWRTSDAKSVLTVAVSLKGRPSAEKTVAALQRKWKQMG
ncbi:hypothetical protein GCM10010168_75340 [Actinoplanes ianthinogenes]|uniref:Serine/threonine protein kinase n=1 Tax=Actinoplanes ianthinogenes TaxID=122358 RepID=A0ABN6CBY8_9ACTN|nr:hypothetical protein [Actinoplanes ianthinogenes]BCJ41846.1 hypothetical protein Aiant_25030 [Actinoplanes ianthinogenes]GGR45518.1 hypothetical protein GCM10010168_75340 [Actinoplanes ianthinogenes]